MIVYIFAIFLSAFLLFQVQPIIARYILPWYGGSPAVWTTCMLCFQVGLLGGYAYAHALVDRFREKRKWQIGIHLGLILLSFLLLPVTPSEALKPTGDSSPVWGIVVLLLSTVGLPYIVISASGPLLQHWFGELSKGKSPYRLYAISNFGSLLGLLSYPFLFERFFGLKLQTWMWSGGYIVYAILAGVCGWLLLRSETFGSGDSEKVAEPEAASPGWRDRLLWIAFAACGSIMLLASTNQMCQDVAVVPFLWVLPLGLYLITFIISFDHARWYQRTVWIPLAMVSVGGMVFLLNREYSDADEIHLALQIAIYALAMFCCCMICHGEMVRLKPAPRFLTSFYLAVSLGGALGGVFVSLIAPRIFPGYWELHAGLVAVAILTTLILFRQRWKEGSVFWKGAFTVVWIQALVVLGIFLGRHIEEQISDSVASCRSFYGVLRVYEGYQGTEDHYRALYHGRISHGRQFFFDEDYRRWAGTYYTEDSGPGMTFAYHPSRGDVQKPMKFGVVGLGIGTLAAYARPGDEVKMYEINPQVEELARKHFTYLEDCLGEESVVLGDARISLEQELARDDRQNFDALFVDAFSGDSIPIHLLTREAFELYFQHLKDDGTLVVHITNLHLDLSDPVRVLAEEFGKECLLVEYDSDRWDTNYSSWILIGEPGNELLQEIRSRNLDTEWYRSEARRIHWTDDYSNLFDVIDWE